MSGNRFVPRPFYGAPRQVERFFERPPEKECDFESQRRAIRIAMAGLWIGLWIGALALSVWGIVFCNTHPLSDYRSCFWFWVSFGPLALLVIRLWKWALTICLLALGLHHELLAGVCIALGWANRRAGLRAYGQWLVKKPQGPGALSSGDRLLLRFAVLCGVAIYALSAWNFHPALPDPALLRQVPAEVLELAPDMKFYPQRVNAYLDHPARFLNAAKYYALREWEDYDITGGKRPVCARPPGVSDDYL
jgi:hypothetical protein